METYFDQWGQVKEKKAFLSWSDQAGAISESYTYDLAGNIKTYTNPSGFTTNYTPDKLDRLYQVEDPKNQVTEYHYTVLGELKSIKQIDGAKTWESTREYNEKGQLTKRATPLNASEQFIPRPRQSKKQA